MQTNWDDLRFVLAVAELGSVGRAARRLEVNHATVLRRIHAFETAHGLTLFSKTRRGYVVAPDKTDLLERVRAAGAAMGDVARYIDTLRPAVGGAIRVTSTDSLCQIVLPSLVARLAEENGAPIDLQSSNAHMDFARAEAEITVRPAIRLPDELIGEKAGRLAFGVYARPGASDWLGLAGPLARSSAGQWMEAEGHAAAARMSADSFMTLLSLAKAGAGQAVLPVFLGESEPALTRIPVKEAPDPATLWVASHKEFAAAPRLKALRSRIVAHLLSMKDRLAG